MMVILDLNKNLFDFIYNIISNFYDKKIKFGAAILLYSIINKLNDSYFILILYLIFVLPIVYRHIFYIIYSFSNYLVSKNH
jgi:hypothetical protein